MLHCSRSFSSGIYLPEIQYFYVYDPVYGPSSFCSKVWNLCCDFHQGKVCTHPHPEIWGLWSTLRDDSTQTLVLKFCLHFISTSELLLVLFFLLLSLLALPVSRTSEPLFSNILFSVLSKCFLRLLKGCFFKCCKTAVELSKSPLLCDTESV